MTTDIGRPLGVGQTTLAVGPIQKAFDEAYETKRNTRDRINQIVKQVHPGLWWREDGQQPDQDLGQVRQTVGMYGLASIRGKILDSTWPIGQNPIRFELCCDADDNEYTPEQKQKAKTYLDSQALKLWDVMLSARASERAFPSGRGFMASMSIATDFGLCHGDACVWGQKDLLFEVMRPEQWASVRDGQGNELRIILRRQFDPRTLKPKDLAEIKLPDGWMSKPTFERMVWIYTDYRWNDGKWEQTDECNGNSIFTETHEEARIYTLPWYFIPGDQYGRPFFETVYGKLFELAHLNGAKTDIVNQCADLKIVLDQNTTIRPARLVGPTGAIITGGNVRDGKAQDVGVISVNKHQDLNEVRQEARLIEMDLSKALGLELELIPNKERTTSRHVDEVVSRLNAMTGGQVLSFTESMTNKTIRCAVDIAIKEGFFDKVPDDIKDIVGKWMDVRITAGPAAMARAQNVQKTVAWAQVAQTIGTATLPDDVDKTGIILDLAADMGLDLAKHRYTPAQVEAMKQREAARQVQTESAINASKALSDAAAPGIVGAPQ